jgi:hypothetical protein
MRLSNRPAAVTAVLALGIAGLGAALRAVDARPDSRPGCRSDPSAGVHDPKRLMLLAACTEVVGTVIKVPHTPSDGDHTFNVKVDPAYVSLLNAQNRADGGIHVEIVPMDQPGCTPGRPISKPSGYGNLGVCSGANIATPPLGARVRVVGPYVEDEWAGPNEIHPAWQVDVLSSTTPPVTPAPTTTIVRPPPTTTKQARRKVTLRALLTGLGVVGHRRARFGQASVVLTLAAPKLCWRFTAVGGVGGPTRARLGAGAAGHRGRLLVWLGGRYSRQGCVRVDTDTVLEPLAERPGQHYVTLSSHAYPRGAVRGQLALG